MGLSGEKRDRRLPPRLTFPVGLWGEEEECG